MGDRGESTAAPAAGSATCIDRAAGARAPPLAPPTAGSATLIGRPPRSAPSSTSTAGNSHIPPSSPSRGRRTTSVLPRGETATCTSQVRVGTGRRLRLSGRSAAVPAARARQPAASGHAPHFGDRGVHTVAPNSIIASLKSPGRAVSISSAARPRTCAREGSGRSNSRATTRRTLPSTAGTASPKAMLATAAAVYGPIPGRARRPAADEGNTPPCSSRTCRAHRCALRARA